MKRLFRDKIVSCDFSENIVVIKTVPGGANHVASVLDTIGWVEIIGTVAGDDNILAVVRPKEEAVKIVERIKRLVH